MFSLTDRVQCSACQTSTLSSSPMTIPGQVHSSWSLSPLHMASCACPSFPQILAQRCSLAHFGLRINAIRLDARVRPYPAPLVVVKRLGSLMGLSGGDWVQDSS